MIATVTATTSVNMYMSIVLILMITNFIYFFIKNVGDFINKQFLNKKIIPCENSIKIMILEETVNR